MGRIRPSFVKIRAIRLVNEYPGEFTPDFENNKVLVEKVVTKMVENEYGETVEITKGRKLTGSGQKLLDECAHSIRDDANTMAPGLSKY